MVQSLNEVLDVGEFEESQPSVVVVLDLIVDDHDEASNHVGCNYASQTDKSFLADA